MGYTTYFSGSMKIEPPLTPEQVAYINQFANTRRMKRDAEVVKDMADPLRTAVGLPVGAEGEYFVNADGFKGQEADNSVRDINKPPKTQPGLWCHWEVSSDGTTLEWDEGEKFYDYIEWLTYIVEHFLKPWGRSLDGEIYWSGDDDEDKGVIYAKGDRVEGVQSEIVNDGPSWR